jgi:hypothetical protein
VRFQPRAQSPVLPFVDDAKIMRKDNHLSLLRLGSAGLRKAAEALDHATAAQKIRAARRAGAVLDEYASGMPSGQNAVDALPGWNLALPDHVGVKAGRGTLYNDPRILWALEQFGSIEGSKILELGPLEAAHTYLLERHGPAVIHAIEANKLSFLRCLVVKELLELQRARFFLGDFMEWLEHSPERYDLIVASGVLYHLPNPVRLLELLAKAGGAFYLWTHYASDEAMPAGDPRRSAFLGAAETQESHGIRVRLHKRSYHGAWLSKSFCGGMHDIHCWMEKDDILAVIRALGFTDIRVAHDEPGHPNGPSFSVFARRAQSQ